MPNAAKRRSDTPPTALGAEQKKQKSIRQAEKKTKAKRPKLATNAKPADTTRFRASTKGAAIVDLLKRKQGATISELMKATGWQAHSVRGFVSGTLKKKLGLAIASERSEGGQRHYRIES